jgi:predicted anti-sigma-YlaC factor YlaD
MNIWHALNRNLRRCAGVALLVTVANGCSVKKYAINTLGDALSGSGATFASDDDPELIKAAIPFSLKLIESLLAESPTHEGLLLAACSGFTQYSFAFVQQEADEKEDSDLAAADVLRARAKRLYARARRYGLRGLEASHPNLTQELSRNPKAAVQSATIDDLPLLFWTAAAWGAAISISKDDPSMISDQVVVEALIDRALELNEAFQHGAIHGFLIAYEMARQGAKGDAAARSKKHFDRALVLSNGQLASPFVSLAESVALENQDRAGFETLLNRALAVDPDARPEWRLQNLIAQRRARWLLGRVDELFLDGTKTDSK